MGYAELIGLALAAAGTATSMKSASDARAASNDEIQSALLATQGYQKQATPVFQDSLAKSGVEVAKQNIGQGTEQAKSMYDQVSKIPQGSAVSQLPIDQSRLLGQVGQARNANAVGQGYNNMGLLDWLKNQEAMRNLNLISGQANSAASLAGPLASLAQQKSGNLAGVGSLMSSAGSLGAIYGALNAQRQPPQLNLSTPSMPNV